MTMPSKSVREEHDPAYATMPMSRENVIAKHDPAYAVTK